ncbi:S-type pyocin domain-containing protein [Streptomyces uncialis]|uniref:S-type pyocin domain-containing protein n=1 Tax=Streptomyces uncialis TaxID=1048205 RepID=UPI003868D9B6|nr:S-type pyocin domain-containing protein [Streptomyces uncialis]
MREAEAQQADEVIALHQHTHQPRNRNQPQNHRPRAAAAAASASEEATDHQETRDGAEAAEPVPTTVLNAERGIINTGTVHGGQHVTTVEFPGHRAAGAGHDL